MKTRILLMCIAVFSFMVITPNAFACSCIAEWSIEDDFVKGIQYLVEQGIIQA